MGRKDLAEQLLDFEATRLRREDCIITWKAIADELGVSEDTVQNWFTQRDLKLPRWGSRERSPVFLPKGKIVILKALYFAS